MLSFANLTGTPTKDYLGDGIAEELIDGEQDRENLGQALWSRSQIAY